jgi:NADH:ubiquinone oxidoreductase subunit K
MSAGMSTFVVLLAWAAPIAIALIFMAMFYRSPSKEELEKYDEMQPDEVAPTPEALTARQ